MGAAYKFSRHLQKQVRKMTMAQRIVVAAVIVIAITAGLLLTIYHEAIFVAFLPLAKKWR